jgi:sigma-E factor negative regulatory protein RseB
MPGGSLRGGPPRAPAWALLGLLTLSLGAAASERDPSAWLERMWEAARTLNYTGTFIYRHGGHLEAMQVVHRVTSDGEQERLVSLHGAPKELLRDKDGVTCIRADNRSVLVDKSAATGLLVGALRLPGQRLEDHYALRVGDRHRVAGRSATLVEVKPADEYRYGFRLWLDEEKGLLLKSELVGEGGEALEEFLFTSIDFPAEIPASLLEPGVDGEGFRWFTPRGTQRTESVAEMRWVFGWLPPGFSRLSHAREPLSGRDQPVEHLVYTDGLAAFSIYLEEVGSAEVAHAGLYRVGAVSAVGRRLGNYQVTVVGEVPSVTVDLVARAVERR